jgi:small subunit ribosomal protein S9
MAEKKKAAEKAPKKKKKTIRKKYFYAVGRRKSASAQVRLFSGKGETLVNQQPIDRYFPGKVAEVFYTKPLRVCNVLGKYYATIKVSGSGKNGQLGAVIHGLARALDKADRENHHLILKRHKLLTRDSRRKERSKPGQMGKARKKKQSPKR